MRAPCRHYEQREGSAHDRDDEQRRDDLRIASGQPSVDRHATGIGHSCEIDCQRRRGDSHIRLVHAPAKDRPRL